MIITFGIVNESYCVISLLAVRQVEMLEVILKNLQVVVVDLC